MAVLIKKEESTGTDPELSPTDSELPPTDWIFPWMDSEGKAAFPQTSIGPWVDVVNVSTTIDEKLTISQYEEGSVTCISRSGSQSSRMILKTEGGESSGNNASNGTTQQVAEPKEAEAAAEASTAPKQAVDDLQELAARGLCAPLWRTSKPSQPGVGVPDVETLQTGWCNYQGQGGVQRGSLWRAADSPAVQARQKSTGPLMPEALYVNHSGPRRLSGDHLNGFPSVGPPSQMHTSPPFRRMPGLEPPSRVFSAQPPSQPLLPPSPFGDKGVGPPQPFSAQPQDVPTSSLAPVASGHDDSPFGASTATKFQWPEDAQSPRQSLSGETQMARNTSITRQVSLPDIGELADLWTEMANVVPDDFGLDIPTSLPSLSKDCEPAMGLNLRQSSLARLQRVPEIATGAILSDLKQQRRQRSMKFNTALTWQPGGPRLEPQAQEWAGGFDRLRNNFQPKRSTGKLQGMQMGPAPRLMLSDRSGSSGFHSSGEASRQPSEPELPEQVQMSIVQAPSIFAVPTCINKSFKPAFTIRVVVVSHHRTQIKATVAAYTLQKEQVAKLEQWHPSQHVFTETLTGAIESETIVCNGPTNPKLEESYPGKHVGVSNFTFSDLRFCSSSRMKPRWLVFALALPTEDVIFTQYTVPTIVMSRQCDQTPRAQAILRGEVPTRKRARSDSDPPRPRTAFPLAAPIPSTTGRPAPGLSPGGRRTPPPPRSNYSPQESGSARGTPPQQEDSSEWPLPGPYDIQNWRAAIVKVCRQYGLTRPFEQEDMHELANVAGFWTNPVQMGPGGERMPANLSFAQWQAFGSWFLSYLRIFNDNKDAWMSMDPIKICGFHVTREKSEHLLNGQQEGTFLLRPSLAMAATVVISVVMQGRVCHLAIDAANLAERTLEDWVGEVFEAQQLLDISSGLRCNKHQVFMIPGAPPGLRGMHPHLAAGCATPPHIQQQTLNPSLYGAPQPGGGGGMPPIGTLQSHGSDALAQIIEMARRGESLPQLPPGMPAAQPAVDPYAQMLGQWDRQMPFNPLAGGAMGSSPFSTSQGGNTMLGSAPMYDSMLFRGGDPLQGQYPVAQMQNHGGMRFVRQ